MANISDDIQPQQLWSKVAMSFGFGDVMITLGTGKLTRDEEDEFGLAGEHDYAVLDVKEVDLQRLLLIKNPWCDGMVWKGSHSVSNVSPPAWTEDLRESLPNNCTTTASGTFWMRFEDILQHFESLYLNWNPGLFLHREDHHFTWAPSLTSTPGFFTENPQYSVSTTTKGTIWVMLSRHFSTEEHNIVKKHVATVSGVSSALGFISLYVFDNGGRRVYLSDDALYRGPFVDSPQTLARLEVEPSSAYTIVVAQDSLPLPKYSFTLSFFSRSTLAVNLAEHPLACSTTHKGAWASHTAGGSASAPSYPINPQYSISIPSLTNVTLVLETDQKELAVHVQMVWTGGEQVTSITARDILGGSGDYRRGCALTSLKKVLAGKYTIVCSTFEAGQIGKFTLRVFSTVPCTVVPLLAEAAGRLSRRLQPLTFHNGENRMLTPLSVLRLTRLRVVARYGSASQMSLSKPLLKVSLERGQGPNKTILDSSGSGRFSEALMGIRTADVDLSPGMSQSGGLWIVVERLEGRHCIDDVNVELLSDSAVNVGLWGTGDG
jgi:calpain-7